MKKQISTTIGILIILLVAGIVGVGVLFLSKEDNFEAERAIINKDTNLERDVFVDRIMVPVIDNTSSVELGEEIGYDTEAMREAQERGDYIGCGDRVAYIEKEIEPTSRPLEAIYLELFKGDEIVEGTDYENPLSYHIKERVIESGEEYYTTKPLEFERVVLEEDRAKLYLSGEYLTIGTCEPPRIEAVLRFAALQYDWINNVDIYLNGEEMEFIHGGKG